MFPFGGMGWGELLVLGVIGVLLFGKRLPEVGRSLGRSFVEFKQGLQGIEREVSDVGRTPVAQSSRSSATSSHYHDVDDRDESIAPKFDPPTAEPRDETVKA